MTTVTDDFTHLSPGEDIANDGSWIYEVGASGSLRGISTGGALEVGVPGSRVSALSTTALSAGSIYVQAEITRLASGSYASLGVTARCTFFQNTFYYLETDSINGVYYLAKAINNVDQWSVTIPVVPAVGHIFKLVITSGNIVQAFIDQGSGFPVTPNGSHDDSASPLGGFFIGVEGFQVAPGNSWWGTAWWPSPWWGTSWWPDYVAIAPAIDNFAAGDIATGATATGGLASASAAVTGVAERVITSTGVLAAAASTVAGYQGTTTITSTGTLASQAATATGTGNKSEFANSWFGNHWWPEPYWDNSWWQTSGIPAIGSLTAQAASMAGTAKRAGDTTGALAAQAATVAGIAFATKVIDATGALDAQAATLSGTGLNTVVSSGALASGAAAIVGLAQLEGITVAFGILSSVSSSMAGTGLREITSAGDLAAGDAVISSFGSLGITSSGTLAADAAAVSGAGTTSPYLIIGNLVADAATVEGYGFREIVARGDIQANPAILSGLAGLSAHPTARDLLLRACFSAFESGEAFDGLSVQVHIDLDKLTAKDLLWTALKHAGEPTEDPE